MKLKRRKYKEGKNKQSSERRKCKKEGNEKHRKNKGKRRDR